MNYTGKIIVLAYPDTFVTMSDEWICKFLPWVGLGTREYIKAGHAALVLIENETGEANYYDFGRYITPNGYGRVRSVHTDAELAMPLKGEFSERGALKNTHEFLTWLEAHPEKTHGEGRLLASVCEAIDHETARSFILKLQERGSIPYGAFDKTGSNCSRFVTDTLLTATSEKKIIKALKFNKRFTPSTVGNVEKAALGDVFEVFDGDVKIFKGSAFRENLKNYFDTRRDDEIKRVSTKKPLDDDQIDLPVSAQKLAGIGSSAWFELLIEKSLPRNHVRVRRYNDQHSIDFDGIYRSDEFDPKVEYEFTYDSHCSYCHVLQVGKKIRLDCIDTYARFSSSRKVRSA
ncbi:MAG: hypothetical protein KJO23_02555 [Bacteroidia bacterium]|nr:hypothetical protein [Bacteroidia bacterium]